MQDDSSSSSCSPSSVSSTSGEVSLLAVNTDTASELSGPAAAMHALEIIFAAESPSVVASSSSSSTTYTQAPLSQSGGTAPTASVLPMDLFNEISKFGALVILDCRSLIDYQESHIPRAMHFPIADADVEGQSSLEQLVKKLDKTEQRTFMRRQRAMVVAYGPHAGYLSGLLTAEGKVAAVKVLQGGFEAFHQKFPFLACEFKPEERKSGRHNHAPPFPWYPNEIVSDKVYLGNHVDADNKLHLGHLQVKHVMNVSNDVENLHTGEFNYTRISLPDNEEEDIGQHFERAFAFLDEAESKGERVFVHCHQGVSRSATIVLAYLMKKNDWSLKQAYSYVKDKRKQINPNIGFWKQLEKLEIGLRGSSTLNECVDISLMELELKNKKAGLNPDGTMEATQ